MFIAESTIKRLKNQYGKPESVTFEFDVTEKEYSRIESSQKNGRKHDVTMYIIKDDKIIVIAKHFYPPDLFRAPSGGVKPGEDFITGAKREAMEETGCEIKIEKFLLESNVNFINDNDYIEWTSYVFQAEYLSGDFKFTDKHEIREVRLANLDEFDKFSKIMRSTKMGGLHYRAELHDMIEPLLDI